MRNTNEIKKAIQEPNFNWLGRDGFIEGFSNFIMNQELSTHVCIDGVWGSGKTTTVFGIINYLNKELDKEHRPLTIYLNVWKYEHYEHPLFALLKVMEENLPSIFDKIKAEFKEKSLDVQLEVNSPLFGISLNTSKDGQHKKILSQAEYIDVLNNLLIDVVKFYKQENGNKLVIFIDEIDRAKPDFALRVIEMFHHLQDDLPTHIVYSVDMNQLNSIIKHYYGYEYNVEIFSHKVFDTVIPLKKLTDKEIENYIIDKINKHNTFISSGDIVQQLLKYLSSSQKESLRSINRVCANIVRKLNLSYFSSRGQGNANRVYFLGENKYFYAYIELLVVLEVISLNNPMKVTEYLNGGNLKELGDFIIDHKENQEYYYGLLNLLFASYNYVESEQAEDIEYYDLNDVQIVTALKNIFNPPKRSLYSNKSVFDEYGTHKFL